MTTEERIKIPSRNSVVTFVILIILLGGILMYVSFVNLFNEKKALQASMQTAAATEPVIKNLDTETLDTEQYADLDTYGNKKGAAQSGVEPYNENIPSVPENIRIVDPAIGKTIYVFWSDAKPKAEFVNVYRSNTKDVLGIKIGSVSQEKGTYVDATVENNIPYYYTLKSANGTGTSQKESSASEQFSGIASDTTPPPPPTQVEVQNGGNGTSVVITWKNPAETDFAYVKIYRSEEKGELGAEIKSKLTSETYEDTGLEQGVMYYYTLTSVDKSNNESSTKLNIPAAGRDNPFEPAE